MLKIVIFEGNLKKFLKIENLYLGFNKTRAGVIAKIFMRAIPKNGENILTLL